MWNKFNRWHSANAYVRVDYAALFEILEMKPKADWQSNFCIRVPMGNLRLTPRIGAAIGRTPTTDRKEKASSTRGIGAGEAMGCCRCSLKHHRSTVIK